MFCLVILKCLKIYFNFLFLCNNIFFDFLVYLIILFVGSFLGSVKMLWFFFRFIFCLCIVMNRGSFFSKVR